MRKRDKHDKTSSELDQLIRHLVEMSSPHEESPSALSPALSAYMAAIGSKGGKIGGKRRLETMTAKERSTVAKKAAKARWNRIKKL